MRTGLPVCAARGPFFVPIRGRRIGRLPLPRAALTETLETTLCTKGSAYCREASDIYMPQGLQGLR